jgi:two-component system, OmpR family, sensor histidine kinase BaeS
MTEIGDIRSTTPRPPTQLDLVPSREGAGGFLSPIAWRLAVAIALVSLVALALLTGITLAFVNTDVSTMANQREDDLAHAVANSLSVSYRGHDSWSNADLSASLALAAHAGIAVRVTDSSGSLVAAAVPESTRHGALGQPRSLPVLVDGHRVGTVLVRIGDTGIGAVGDSFRGTLAAAVGGSAAAVALLALIAGFVAARRITRPVVSLTRAAQAMAAGEHGARVGDVAALGELAELSRAFDHMADALERQDHLRRMLVADVAHELRTPLAVLQASTEALADGVIESNAQTLSSLRDEALRLSRSVEDLEVLASAQAAGLTLDNRPVDLAEVAERAADAMEARLATADLTLARSLEPVVVRGDKARLHQVVTNLLNNAAKFTAAGGRISLTVEASDREARLVVADSGIGIPTDELPLVFERFWRGRAARRVAGSGIGLAVVAELVHAHGGEVRVTSTEEKGACFVVTLPRL